MADRVFLFGGHVCKRSVVALGLEDGVIAKARGPGALEGNRAPARAFDEVLLAVVNEADGCAELGGPGFGGGGANADELGEELRHVGFRVAVGAGVTCAQHAGRPFQGVDLEARIVRETIETIVGNDVARLDLGVALEGGGVFDDLFVAPNVSQALDAVAVAEHFLELTHLVGVVRGENEDGKSVVVGLVHVAKVRRMRAGRMRAGRMRAGRKLAGRKRVG